MVKDLLIIFFLLLKEELYMLTSVFFFFLKNLIETFSTIATSNIIISLSTIVTAGATTFYTIFTRKIILQQKKEEIIKYSPYLNIKNFTISEDGEIFFEINNSGSTPAYHMNVTIEVVVDDLSIWNNNEEDKSYIIVIPNSERLFNQVLNSSVLDKIKLYKKNCIFIINLNYLNYKNDLIKLENYIDIYYNDYDMKFDYGYIKQDFRK